MKSERSTRKIGNLAVLLLVGIFASCLLAVLLSGAKVYRGVTERGQESFDRRTAAQYLATRVRQSDMADALWVENFGDGAALVTAEEIDGVRYETRIYCHEGWLRELFAEAGYEAAPEDGEQVLPLAALELTLESGLLRAVLWGAEGSETELLLSCRSGKEADDAG